VTTYAERLTKISLVVAEIFGWICRFYRLVQKDAVVTLTISRVTISNNTKIVNNVEKFILFNLLKSELRYCNLFWNVSATKEIGLRKRRFFDCNWLPWQRPLRNQKSGPDRSYSNKYLSFGAMIAKIGPVDSEIICLHLKKKEINASKIYSPASNLAEQAKLKYFS